MPVDRATCQATLAFFEKLTILLHPFMPFITEEIWQSIAVRKTGESVMIATMPEAVTKNDPIMAAMDTVMQIIAGVRSIRLERNIANREALVLNIVSGEYNADYNAVIMKMCQLEQIGRAAKDATSASFMVGTTVFSVPLGSALIIEEEINKMNEEIKYLEGFLQSVEKKLNNEKFVAKADPKVVENERKKQADTLLKINNYNLRIRDYERREKKP